MNVSTMTNLFYEYPKNGENAYVESVRKTHAAGFDVMDFCMCPMQRRETELNGDNWKFLVDRIGNEAAKLGVRFTQSHIPYAKNKRISVRPTRAASRMSSLSKRQSAALRSAQCSASNGLLLIP